MNHRSFCASTIAVTPIEPASIVGMSSVSTIGISYDTSCATARNAPSRANLLFDDQPAMMMPSVPMAPMETMYRTPTFRSVPRNPGAKGTTAQMPTTDMTTSSGASQ